MTTNYRETREMLWEYKHVIIIGILYLLVLYYLLLKLVKRKIHNGTLLVGITILMLVPAKKSYDKYHANRVEYNKIGGSSLSLYLEQSPINTLAPFVEAKVFLKAVKEFDKQFKYPFFEVEETGIENIVVVIGESARKDALHLYGNIEQTTPLIERRVENLLIYNNAVSPSSFTNLAVTLLLSKQLPSNEFTIEKNSDNLIALANSSKVWSTYWLSSQENAGIYVNLFSMINSHAIYKEWTKGSKYDEAILPLLTQRIKDENKKRLIFIHINGSHALVNERYPNTFMKFSNNKKRFVNEYNNSILYTDYVLNEIIEQVKDTKSIVIYVSDHGQSIMSDSYKHSFTKKGVEVPFFIWHSDGVNESFKKTGRIDTPISTTNLYNIVSDYMGIKGLEAKNENSELKLLNPSIETVLYSEMEEGL
ncbi:phosphoethanolamine transferase [Myroides marinus]|uniref:phosphoethanolamine transferase n=1 Tax=Myroides marinus TaxID=703342 RepID=UPI0025755547|nr:phosphoethanolamine transferase [Myroides marinus]MDM1503169.1 phosphoethanolamine transferase [Myroides marinus]